MERCSLALGCCNDCDRRYPTVAVLRGRLLVDSKEAGPRCHDGVDSSRGTRILRTSASCERNPLPFGWRASPAVCLATALVLCLAAPACSPEARRVRGGGPGADVGNRGDEVVLHDARKPFHATPIVQSVR